MPMTQLECFKATMEHQPHQGFLFYAEFTSDIDKRVKKEFNIGKEGIREHFGMYNPWGVGLRAPKDLVKPDFSGYFEDINIPENAYINDLGVLNIPGSLYHFTQYVSPLRNASKLEDLESFPYPSVEGYSEEGMAEAVEKAHLNGRPASTWIGHMYEDSWQIRGYQQFLMDMIERPEWCEYILDKLTEKNIRIAEAAARAGVDIIASGDDVANQNTLMFSPDSWRRFMKSRWAKVYSAARKIKPDIQIWYHSDGNIESIIPELIEIGVTVLNPVQPECMDVIKLKKQFGRQLVFDGTIGTQSTMPFGTPEQVKKVIRERIDTLGQDGALILSPTHVLEPEVPLANVQAFVEGVQEFGIIK